MLSTLSWCCADVVLMLSYGLLSDENTTTNAIASDMLCSADAIANAIASVMLCSANAAANAHANVDDAHAMLCFNVLWRMLLMPWRCCDVLCFAILCYANADANTIPC